MSACCLLSQDRPLCFDYQMIHESSNCSNVCIPDFQEDSHQMVCSIYVSLCSTESSNGTNLGTQQGLFLCVQ